MSGVRHCLNRTVATLGIVATACTLDPTSHCPPHGYEAGERFRITVLGVIASGLDTTDPKNANAGASDGGALECAPLQIGDSFVMEAAPWLDGGNQCDKSRVANMRSPFGGEEVPFCDGGQGQLGMNCREDQDPYTCTKSMAFTTYPLIKPTDQTIVDGMLQVVWSTCETGCATDFRIRIERLPPAPSDAG